MTSNDVTSCPESTNFSNQNQFLSHWVATRSDDHEDFVYFGHKNYAAAPADSDVCVCNLKSDLLKRKCDNNVAMTREFVCLCTLCDVSLYDGSTICIVNKHFKVPTFSFV